MPWKPSEPGERPTLGWIVLDWIQENLVVPDGPTAGDPLTFTLEQAAFILKLYEVNPRFSGDAIVGRSMVNGRKVRRAVLSRPKGWGKSPLVAGLCLVEAVGDVVMDGWDANGQPVARPWNSLGFKPKVQIVAVSEDQPLALDTPIRTPDGWTTVGQIDVGDRVFDSRGRAVTVRRTTAVLRDLDCYEVAFDDGERITCSASHAWTVERINPHGDKMCEETLTTEEMARSTRRMRVPLTAQHGATADLPVDPYLMGLWLGDGDTSDASIAIDWRDLDEMQALITAHIEPWEEITATHAKGNSGRLRVKRRDGICPRGHHYACGPNRMVYSGHPACRRCCAGQRIGRTEPVLPTLRERLRAAGTLGRKHIPHRYLFAAYEQRMELLRGLVDSDGNITTKGRASFTNANSELFDQVCELLTSLGFRWSVTLAAGSARRVHWTPRPFERVAKIARKAARQIDSDRPLSRYRRIVSVTPTASVPVRCIGIDTADHLFLAGRLCVPTHNTANTWEPCLDMARNGPIYDNYDIDPMETFINVPRGRVEAVTSSGSSREGFRPVFCAMDQTESWTSTNGGIKLASTLRRNLAKVNGCSVETPNAPEPGVDSVAEKSMAAYRLQLEGRTKLPAGILVDHREAPADTDPSDEASLRAGLAVAYGDSADVNGGWAPLDRIVADYWDPDTDPQEARRFYLNQITHSSDAWVSQPSWKACEDLDKQLQPGDTIVLGFDGSKGRVKGKADATALVGCRVTDAHLFELLVAEPTKEDGQNWAPNPLDFDFAVQQAFDRYKVIGFYADPSGWVEWVAKWEARYRSKLRVKASAEHPIQVWPRGKDARVEHYIRQLEQAVTNREVTQYGPALTRHVLNARRRPTRTGYLLFKRSPDSADKIDAAYAAVMAWKAYLDAVSAGADEPKRSGKVW